MASAKGKAKPRPRPGGPDSPEANRAAKVLSVRLPVEVFREALFRVPLVWPPAGLEQMRVRLQLLPLGPGQRQQVIADPAWIGVATRLVRELG